MTNENMNDVESLCGGDVKLWIDQEAIHVKMSDPHGDPLELSVDEARELAQVLLRFADHLDE